MAENVNCLVGMSCRCGSLGPFMIELCTIVEVTDDGTDANGSTADWTEDGYCQCAACGYTATVKDFHNTLTKRCHGMTVELVRSKVGDGWCGRITDHPWSDDKPDPPFDAIASLILAHACAGIDIESPAYEAGVNDAVTAIANEA